jgi:hypothetical protein
MRVFLDRYEGEKAVLQLGPEGRESLVIPRELLPKETKEGAALELSLSPAPEDKTQGEVQSLMDSLFEETKS